MSECPIETLSLEAEQGVLGSLLLDASAFDRLATPLRPEHFGREDHRLIFAAITERIARGEPADILSVAETLDGRGLGRQTGGLAYLAEMANGTPSAVLIRRHAEIVVERSQLRSLLGAAGEIADVAQSRQLSVAEKLDRAQSLVQAVVEGTATSQPTPQPLAEVMKRHLVRIDERKAGRVQAVSTGFADLDRRLNGGLRPGQLVLVAARPAMGKTSLGLQMADAVTRAGRVALFCSQEMQEGDIADRLLAIQQRISLTSLTSGDEMTNEEWERVSVAVRDSMDSMLHVDEQAALTLTDVATKARQVKRKAGRLDLVVVDYIQLMSGRGDNRNAEIERISRGLKQLAKDMGVPVVALSQLSRECEKRPNKRPMTSDLRDSGALEQDADVILFVYRDEVYNPDSPDKGTAEILLRKNRQGGTGDVRLAWHGFCASFADLDHSAWDEQRRAEQARKEHDRPMRRSRGGFDEF